MFCCMLFVLIKTVDPFSIRGNLYASYSKHFPDWLKVVAVCDPHEFKCQAMAEARRFKLCVLYGFLKI